MQFDKNISEVIEICSKTALSHNFKIYLIGGIVRDLLLNRPVYDIDITVEGNSIDFAHKIKGAQIKSVHSDFGTVKVRFLNGQEADLASTRQEEYPKKGGLPLVKNIGCKLIDDIKRRDFTVNSLAMSLNTENMYEIIDYVGGKRDIESKILKVLHDKSFIDDPTRIIRGLEFSLRFGFRYDEQSKALRNNYLENPQREGLSYERVRLSLKRLFKLNTAEAFDRFIDEKLYKIFTDNIKVQIDGEKIRKATELFKPSEPWQVYYDALNASLQKFDAKSRWEIYSRFKDMNIVNLTLYYAFTQDENALIYFKELKDIKLFINGNDLLDLGFSQGEKLGKALNDTLKEKVEGRLKTREEELQFAHQLYQSMRKF